MVQWNRYVPDAVNVRPIETLLLLPGMSAGVAPPGVSKVTLCATAPKAKVTVSPALTVSGFGVNAKPAVAATVFAGGGGGGGGDCDFEPYGPVPPPHAAKAMRTKALRILELCDMVSTSSCVRVDTTCYERNLSPDSSFVCRSQGKIVVRSRGKIC